MSNQQRPFSWFRLAPFGRQLQPTPAPRPIPAPRPTPPAPQPFRPPPAIRPPAPAVTSPPPPPSPAVAVPARALFPGVVATTTTAQPASRPLTPYTAPASPVKSTPATSVPASPITKQAPSSSPTSPTILRITSSSFNLSSPAIPKPVASPPKSSASPAVFPASGATPSTTVTASTTATTTTISPRIIKTLKESPPKYPETKPMFRPPSAPAPVKEVPKGAPMEQEIKKQMLGQDIAGNSKMNEKAAKLPRRLVALVGENKGAMMVLSPHSTKKSHNGFAGKRRTIGNKEEGSKKKEENEMNTLFINSNVQGVNNSILDDSRLNHHDPGFHLFFSTD